MSSTSAANSITPGPTTALGVASAGAGISVYSPGSSDTTTLAPGSITSAGNSTPHENRQPYLAVNFIIAWAGIYPSQN
jgi:microcystin-dependent protein